MGAVAGRRLKTSGKALIGHDDLENVRHALESYLAADVASVLGG